MRSHSPGRTSLGWTDAQGIPHADDIQLDSAMYESLTACNQGCESKYGASAGDGTNPIQPQYSNCYGYCKELFTGGKGGIALDYDVQTPQDYQAQNPNIIVDSNGNPVSYGPAAPTPQQWAAMNPQQQKAAVKKGITPPSGPVRAGVAAGTDWKAVGLPIAAGFAGLLLVVAFLGQATKAQ